MDEKTTTFLKMIGLKVQFMDIQLLAAINTLNAHTRMIAEKLPSLSPGQRKALLDAASQNETITETIEASSLQFKEAVDAWVRSQ